MNQDFFNFMVGEGRAELESGRSKEKVGHKTYRITWVCTSPACEAVHVETGDLMDCMLLGQSLLLCQAVAISIEDEAFAMEGDEAEAEELLKNFTGVTPG